MTSNNTNQPRQSSTKGVNSETFSPKINQCLDLLRDTRNHPQAYQQISKLMATAQPSIIQSLFNQVLQQVVRVHQDHSLDEYLILWGRIYDGTLMNYPNFYKKLSAVIDFPKKIVYTPRCEYYFTTFNENWRKLQNYEQRVQFFDDDDSMSKSADLDQSSSNVIQMDTKQIQIIRERINDTSIQISKQKMNEYLLKMKNFLIIEPQKSIDEQIQVNFKKEKTWVKTFLQNYDQGIENKNKSNKVSKNIQLDIDQQEICVENNVKNFNRSLGKYQLNTGLNLQLKSNLKQNKQDKRFFKTNQTYSKQLYLQSQASKNEDRRKIFQSKQTSKKPQIKQSKYMNHEQIQQNKSLSYLNNPNFYHNQNIQNSHNISESLNDNIVVINHSKKQKEEQINPFPSVEKNIHNSNQKKKLSDFTSQRKIRKDIAPTLELYIPQDYIIQPYARHFSSYVDFVHFRENCFSNNFAILTSNILVVNCQISNCMKQSAKVEITYLNKTQNVLTVNCAYKIPKCFAIYQQSEIYKKFKLLNNVKHTFILAIESFPLEMCFLKLKYSIANNNILNSEQAQTQTRFNEHENLFFNQFVCLPITIRNFVQHLMVFREEWALKWAKLSNSHNNEYLQRQICLDKNIIDPTEIDIILQEYIPIGKTQMHSAEEYGSQCFISTMNSLNFLIKFSIIVNSYACFEILTQRSLNNDQKEFLTYYINMLSMLLSKKNTYLE